MSKKTLIIGGIIVAVLVLSSLIILVTIPKKNTVATVKNSNDIILYYGSTCPHCLIVENYLKQNDVENKLKAAKINFQQKEVFNDKVAAAEMGAKAVKCKLDTSSIGVPFLWDGTTCLIGDQTIINYFQQKIK